MAGLSSEDILRQIRRSEVAYQNALMACKNKNVLRSLRMSISRMYHLCDLVIKREREWMEVESMSEWTSEELTRAIERCQAVVDAAEAAEKPEAEVEKLRLRVTTLRAWRERALERERRTQRVGG